MRKFFFILMLAVFFALGMFSQNLIAGNWVFPSIGSPTFNLHPEFSDFNRPGGKVYYIMPSGWKVENVGRAGSGSAVFINFKKLE